LTQLDILGRMAYTFFQHKAERYAEEGNYKGVERCNVLGILPWTISRVIPVFIGLAFGVKFVNAINNWIPFWGLNGL
ncbi:PTS sugar transporter subunit IIC, partial [Enterococcus faecalis]|uniref:PTS sugar transporter subunit IIC n=1 Tax=Enterococcus faecalis TaxID=1351 RepID=UPI003CC680C9